MNNEPVAWMYKNDSDTFFSAIDHSVNNKWIPLYTHPVKEHFEDEPQAEELHEILQSNAELTPCEELKEFQEQQNGVFREHNACCYRHECRIVWNDWERLRSNLADLTDDEIKEVITKHYYYNDKKNALYDFARAILRKASEK